MRIRSADITYDFDGGPHLLVTMGGETFAVPFRRLPFTPRASLVLAGNVLHWCEKVGTAKTITGDALRRIFDAEAKALAEAPL